MPERRGSRCALALSFCTNTRNDVSNLPGVRSSHFVFHDLEFDWRGTHRNDNLLDLHCKFIVRRRPLQLRQVCGDRNIAMFLVDQITTITATIENLNV